MIQTRERRPTPKNEAAHETCSQRIGDEETTPVALAAVAGEPTESGVTCDSAPELLEDENARLLAAFTPANLDELEEVTADDFSDLEETAERLLVILDAANLIRSEDEQATTREPNPYARRVIRERVADVQRICARIIRLAPEAGLSREAMARVRMLEAVADDAAEALEENATGEQQ